MQVLCYKRGGRAVLRFSGARFDHFRQGAGLANLATGYNLCQGLPTHNLITQILRKQPHARGGQSREHFGMVSPAA